MLDEAGQDIVGLGPWFLVTGGRHLVLWVDGRPAAGKNESGGSE